MGEGDAATEVDTADTEVVTVGAEACSSKSTTIVVVATTFLFLIYL